MSECRKSFPSSHWVPALPQLVSRICHASADVRAWLKGVLVDVLLSHPHQALWTMAGVMKSNVTVRRETATDIVAAARSATAAGSQHRALFSQVRGGYAFLMGSSQLLLEAGALVSSPPPPPPSSPSPGPCSTMAAGEFSITPH